MIQLHGTFKKTKAVDIKKNYVSVINHGKSSNTIMPLGQSLNLKQWNHKAGFYQDFFPMKPYDIGFCKKVLRYLNIWTKKTSLTTLTGFDRLEHALWFNKEWSLEPNLFDMSA